jgi:hypothetical protein
MKISSVALVVVAALSGGACGGNADGTTQVPVPAVAATAAAPPRARPPGPVVTADPRTITPQQRENVVRGTP